MEGETNPYLPVSHHNEKRVGVRIIWVWMLPLVLGIATPFLAMYLSGEDPRAAHGYYWQLEGWPFPMTQSHAEWPQIGVKAEFQLLPIGIALNIAIGIAMWYCIWTFVWGIATLLAQFASRRDRAKKCT